MSTTLQDLVNRAIFLSTETQTHFGSLIADAEWEVDFTADPHLTFNADGHPLRTRPHLLGSESSTQGTWLWGWENINEFPEAVVGVSHDVRRFGAAAGVDELVTPELDLHDELALRLTLAAKEATGKWAHYPAAAGAGTTVWLLVDVPGLELPEPKVKTSVRALMQGLTQTTVDDHQAALTAYVDRRGIPTVELPDGGIRMLFADGSADLSFDGQRRISNCEVHAPLEGEAATQYSEITGITVSTGRPTSADASAAGSPAAASAGHTPTEAETPDSLSGTAPAAGTPDSPRPGTESVDRAAADEPVTADGRQEHAEAGAEQSAPARSGTEPVGDEQSSAGRPPVDGIGTARAEETRPEHAPTADSASDTEPAREDEEPAGKKKGLFSRLFGR